MTTFYHEEKLDESLSFASNSKSLKMMLMENKHVRSIKLIKKYKFK